MDFPGVLLSILPSALPLAAWIVGVVFAVKMVRQKGGRAERFLLTGASLMLLNSLLVTLSRIFQPWLMVWLVQIKNTPGPTSIPPFFLGIEILRGCIFVAGIICLVYAFWVKFITKPTST